MAIMIWLFDMLLGLGLLALAVSIIRARSLYQAVVMFMVFGLLTALSWARLRAVDIALAEAAIGAGFTGALFLSTIGRLRALARNQEGGKGPQTKETS